MLGARRSAALVRRRSSEEQPGHELDDVGKLGRAVLQVAAEDPHLAVLSAMDLCRIGYWNADVDEYVLDY